MKITERWRHVIVDSANHPRYVVRDATGQRLRANVRYLIRDLTLDEQKSGRRPTEPASVRAKAQEESKN